MCVHLACWRVVAEYVFTGTAAGKEWLFKARLLEVVKSLIIVRSPLRNSAFFIEGTVVVQRIFRFSHTTCDSLGSGKFVTWGESSCRTLLNHSIPRTGGDQSGRGWCQPLACCAPELYNPPEYFYLKPPPTIPSCHVIPRK